MQHLVRGILVWSFCPRVLELHTVNEYILQMCNVEVSVWSITKCRNNMVRNLDQFEIYWDICTTKKDNAHTVTLWGIRCVDEYVRATVWKRRCEKDVVRKSLWERYFFWPALFYWQTFVSKNVLPRLGALHLWCLCFYKYWVLYEVLDNRWNW